MLVPIGTEGEWLGGRGFELRTSSFAGTIDPLTPGKERTTSAQSRSH